MKTIDRSGDATDRWGTGGEAAASAARTMELRATLDAIVSQAETVSEQLVAESQAAAAATTREADERALEIVEQARAAADAIRVQAEADVEEHRRRVRAEVGVQVRREVTEQNRHELALVRTQSQAVIGDLEASVRILGISLESAVANISEMLSALEELRSHTVDPVPGSQAPSRAKAAAHDSDDPLETPLAAEIQRELAPSTAEPRPSPEEPTFGNQASPRSVPVAASVFDEVAAEVGSEVSADPEAAAAESGPRTATEAFLLASRLEPEQPSLADLSAAQTEMLGGDQAEESRRDDVERLRVRAVARDEAASDTEAKPLGWLFRSSQ